MATDFSSILNKPLDTVKRPPPLPQGTYHGMIKGYEFKASRQKQTPLVQFTFTLQAAGEDIAAEDMQDVDLSRKSPTTDFYLTADAEYRLKEFLETLGINTTGRTFGETLPEAISKAVIMEIGHRLNPTDPTAPPYIDVKNVKGDN